MTKLAGGAALLILAALVGCGSPEPRIHLSALPDDLDGMDPGIQRQIREAHTQVARLLAEGKALDERLGDSFGRLGMVYHAYYKHARAKECYLQAAELVPTSERWSYFLALSEQALGDLGAAELAARRTLELREGYPPARLLIAEMLFDRGKIAEAEEQFAALTADDPSLGAAWTGRARCALASGRPEETVEYAREALAWSPRASETHYLLAQAYSALGDPEAAARHFGALPAANLLVERSAVDDPLARELADLRIGALGHTRKGARAFVEKSYRVSLAELDQALAANPGLIHIRYAKAFVLREIGESDAAISELELLLDQHREHELSLNLLAAILVERDRFEEADALLATALSVNPGSEKALASLATIHRLQGRLPEAIDDYRRALALDPGDVTNHFWLAATQALAGTPSAARETLERARSALPNDLALELLELRLGLGAAGADIDEAVAAAEAVVDAGPTVIGVETLAMALAAAGRHRAAVHWQEAAVVAAADPAPWASRRLGRYRRSLEANAPWERDEVVLLDRVDRPDGG